MKKSIFLFMAMGLFFGSVMVGFAQMHGTMKGKGMMMGDDKNQPMMSGMPMCGMMGMKMIETGDGGIVVMCSGKLYKYDQDLNLKKEVEIPMDVEHMKKMRMKMKDFCPMRNTE